MGTGAKPDDRLAASAGLTTDDGIVVDEHCRTSDPAIYAAGDVVRFPGPHGPVRLENWRHAQDQGTVAGRNAAGARDAYVTVPSFWSEQVPISTFRGSAGRFRARSECAGRCPEAASSYSKFMRAGLAIAMGINVQRDLAAARRLIERRTPVDAAALADPAVPLAGMLKR